MSAPIPVQASLRIRRPVHIVRAQYRDIDHHIRANVHPGIRYQWEPAPPGERRIRTTFRILGMPQFDVSRLEDAEDGSFVIRYLEGSNAGMVLVHRFVELSSEETEVQLFADAPATPVRRLLGPLFVQGAKHVMMRALAEDKRDLEQGQFEDGKAKGNVAAALAVVDGLSNESQEVRRAIVEIACFVAACDGGVETTEMDVLTQLAQRLEVEYAQLALALARAEAAASGPTFVSRLQNVAQCLHHGDALSSEPKKRQRAALDAAACVALIAHGVSVGELAALKSLAETLGLRTSDVSERLDAIDRVLGRQ